MGAFGRPFEQPTLRSIVSTLIVEPTLGFDVAHVAQNLPLGATPNSDNWIMREGRLEPRPTLSQLTDSVGTAHPAPTVGALHGGLEVANIAGARYLLCTFSGAERFYWLQGTASQWGSVLLQPSLTSVPTVVYPNYWDWVQMYYDRAEENAAIGVSSAGLQPVVWVPGATGCSHLTGAPNAKCLAGFDHYLLAGNIVDTLEYPQRVMWSDRGSISSWTGGLSGFDDLIGARGGINRLVTIDNRIAVFFDDEIWMGAPVDFPSTFRFIPFDPNVGSPYPLSVTNTPRGPVFMARNFQLYLLPKEGGSAVPIGQPIHRSIRDSIVGATRAFGVYDGIRNRYQFNYSSGGSGNLPHSAVWLNLDTGAWEPQSYASGTGAGGDMALTYGFQANLATSRATSWDGMDPITWNAETRSYDDISGIGSERQSVLVGSSAGTIYQFNSRGTSDDGLPVLSAWETKKLGDEWPGQQKTITKVQLDYAAASQSTLTIRTLRNGAFSTGTRMQLPAASAGSQAEAYPYESNRYAAVRFESEGQRDFALERAFVTMRVGGR